MKKYKLIKERICGYCDCTFKDEGEPVKYGDYGYVCFDCYEGLCS